MNRKLLVLSVIVLLGTVLLQNGPFFAPEVKAQPPAPSIYVLPSVESFSTLNTPVGTQFTVTLWASTPTNDSYGYPTLAWEVWLSFNSTWLQCLSATLTDGNTSQLFAGHKTIVLSGPIDNSAGTVMYGESLEGSDSIGAETGSLISMVFNITEVPTAGQTFTCKIDPGYGVVSGYTGLIDDVAEFEPSLETSYCEYSIQGPVPVSVGSNVTVSPENNLNLTFANVTSRGYASADETPTVPAPVLSNLVGEYCEVIVNASFVGNVTVGLAFDGFNMTQQQKASLTMNLYKPIPGDIAAPYGIVDMKDIATIAAAFGSKPGSANWNPNADVNGDGKVDMKDIAIAAAHFGQTASWTNITTSVDTTNNIIYGTTTHFSLIGIH